ncbi:MAG TPA: hypothetical protein VL325_09505 [Pyrinomonadaceae bacterium]|nr:hypothetical protein [Pyrinomonadaceae bacterium]
MGDFVYKPRIHLLDQQLTLDPDIVAMIREIEAQAAVNRILFDMQRPNWNLLLPDFQSIVSRPTSNIFSLPTPSPAPSIWSSPQGAGPATPRAGELSDVTGAIYQLPAVQRLVGQAHDEGMRQLRVLRSEWDNGSTAQRVTMVTMATVFAGALITPIVANQQTRDMAFGLIKGRDIPVPGIDGLSFKILDNGAGVTTPLGIPGLSASARLQLPNSAAPNYEATINFDIMAFLRSRSSN